MKLAAKQQRLNFKSQGLGHGKLWVLPMKMKEGLQVGQCQANLPCGPVPDTIRKCACQQSFHIVLSVKHDDFAIFLCIESSEQHGNFKNREKRQSQEQHRKFKAKAKNSTANSWLKRRVSIYC